MSEPGEPITATEAVIDEAPRFLVELAQLLGEELVLAFARNMGGHRAGATDLLAQVVVERDAREFRFAQRGQCFG